MAEPLQGETARQRQLKKLSSQFPVANQQVAQGMQAGRTIGMQGQLGALQPGVGGIRAAQAAGAQQAGQASEIAAGAAAKGQTDQVQLGQLGLQESGRAQREQLGQGTLNLQKEQAQHEDTLSRMGENIKQELYNKQMSFQRDQLGQSQLNDRQLADWAVVKSKNAEEFKDYAQYAQQQEQRQSQVMNMAMKKVEEALRTGYLSEKGKLDFEQKKLLMRLNAEAKKNQQKKEAAARNKAAMWQAGGMILGAAAGSFIPGAGTAAGAAMGASVGGGVGQVAGSLEGGE